jgi:ribose/xylose/arabinose/galactoside ABC-type transport system permease subunit
VRQARRNYFLAVFLFLLGLVEVVSGFVLWLALLGGQGYMGGRGLDSEATFLWSRGTWIDLHAVVGVMLVVVVVIHLILHRKWIFRMTKRLGAEEAN